MTDPLITTKNYAKKETERLEAVQVTNENIERVAAVIGAPVLTTTTMERVIGVSRGEIAHVGDYVCRHSGPRPWFKLSREFFERTYDEEF